MGAEGVETVQVLGSPLEPHVKSSVAGPVPVTQFLEIPGNALESPGDIYSGGGGETSTDPTARGELPQPDSEATP